MSAVLRGKAALVTGAGQGVGRGIALALSAAGASVMLAGRTQDKLDAVAAECKVRQADAVAVCHACDVRNPESLAELVKDSVARLGRLDILVNCAQQVPLGRLQDTSDSDLAAGWESGPLATFRLMKLCHPHLKQAGEGNIINLASSAAFRWDLGGYGAYAAVKEAIRQFTRAAACEWAAEGIRSNCLLPLANSPAMEGWTQARPEEAAAFAASVPQQRIGDCENDIGAFVVQLCSPACRYVNGQSIALDGGQAYLG